VSNDHRPGNGVAGMNGAFTGSSDYRPDRPERYSRKVFVGGLPPDIDEGIFTLLKPLSSAV